MNVNYENTTIMEICCLSNVAIKVFRPTHKVHVLTVHTCTQAQSTDAHLPPSPWTHLMMMVREDPNLPPFPSSTCAPVAVRMAVRLALPLPTT